MPRDANFVAFPRKVILPVHHYLPQHTAGAELYTAKLARHLQSRGYSVEIVTIDSTSHGVAGELHSDTTVHDGIPVHRLSFNLDQTPHRELWLFDNPLLGSWFEHRFRLNKPDIVHFQAGYLLGVAPIFAANGCGIPSVLTLHDYWFLCPRHTLLRGDGSLCSEVPEDPTMCAWCNALMKRRYRLVNRLSNGSMGDGISYLFDRHNLMALRRQRLSSALGLVDAIISPSDFLAGMMQSVVERSRIEVVRFGFELERYVQPPPRAAGDPFRIGFIGQVNEHKGVHLLVEAFRRLTSTVPLALDIYGNIPSPVYRQKLERLASGDGRIHFHGRFDNSCVAEILSSFTLCAAPSTWYENSPIAIQEAQIARVPVVTAALGGMEELVAHGVNGLHFSPGSVESLAQQLQRVIDDPILFATLQAGAQQKQIRSIDDEMDDIEDIYHRILTTGRSQCHEI